MRRLTLFSVFFTIMAAGLSAQVQWGGLPWGSSKAKAAAQCRAMGAEVFQDDGNPDLLVASHSAFMATLRFDGRGLKEVFTLQEVGRGEDWGEYLAGVIRIHLRNLGFNPYNVSGPQVVDAVCQNPRRNDAAWFSANVEKRFQVCWKDKAGHHLTVSPTYQAKTKNFAITQLFTR